MRTGASTALAAEGQPTETSSELRGSDRLVAANAEDAKPTSVMATWMVARKSPESDARSRASLALRSPASASGSSAARLADTRAISDAEKYPFAKVRRKVTTTEMAMSMRGGATSLLEFRWRLFYR